MGCGRIFSGMMFPAAVFFCTVMLTVSGAEKGGSADAEVNSVLAVVNGEAVTLKDVLDQSSGREYPFYAAGADRENYEAVKSLRRKVVDEIINRKLLLAEYRRQPFEIPSQYLESFLDDLAQNYGCRTRSEFARRLRRDGSSIEEFREKAKERLIEQAMLGRQISSRVHVSPKQVAEYMQANNIIPEAEVHLFLLLTGETPELKDRAAFEAYAREKSRAGNRENGGDYSWCRRKRLRREFQEALKGAKLGEVCGPVKTAEGNFYLLIAEERMTDASGMDAAAVRRLLEAKERERVSREYLDELRKDATIRYYF